MSHYGGGGNDDRYGGGGYDRREQDRRDGRGDRGRYDGDREYRDRGGGGDRGGRGRNHGGGGGRGGGRSGGRGGGRGGGGGGGGRRESDVRPQWEREGLPVQANLFRLKFDVANATWYWYNIQINNVKKVPKKDAEGNVIKENGETQFEFIVGRSMFDERDLSQQDNEAETTKQERRNRASHLSRRIISVFQKEIGVRLINDGSSIAISPTQIEGLSTSADGRPQRKKKESSSAGIYGPSDMGGSAPAPEQNPVIKPWRVYEPIKVRRDCDDDDPEAHLSQLSWFQIKLTQVGSFTFSVAPDGSIKGTDKAPEACCQAINLAVKNAMLGRMLALDRDTRCFYYKKSPYGNNHPGLKIGYNDKCMPLYGLLQTAKLTANGVCILADLGLGWQRLDKDQKDQPIRVWVPDIHGEGGQLAGVRIKDSTKPIPERQREEVHRALKKTNFHVKYTSPKTWVGMKAQQPMKGFDDGDEEGKRKHWEKRAKMGKRNQRLFKILKSKEMEDTNIKWSADDPNDHSFDFAFFSPKGEKEETRKITVAEYYRQRYHINLNFPKMPLVRISQQEWFPVEFLFVSQGTASGGASELADRKTQFALKFNDLFACQERIAQISSLIGNPDVYHELTSKLELLNLSMDTAPMQLRSKVLKMPRLLDGSGREIRIDNGSWSLRDQTFKKPATMHSFAVLNLAGRDPGDLPLEIFRALSRHGVDLAFINGEKNSNIGQPASDADIANYFWKKVSVMPRSDVSKNPVELRRAFDSAKTTARNVFMNESLDLNLCFRTLARVEGELGLDAKEVVVFPSWLANKPENVELQDQKNLRFAVMDYIHFRNRPTHHVVLPGSIHPRYAFLMYNLTLENGAKVQLAPTDVRFTGVSTEVLDPDKNWVDIRNLRIDPIFWVDDVDQRIWRPGDLESYRLLETFGNDDGVEYRPSFIVDVSDIECPSLIYVLLSQNTKDLYYWSKWASYLGGHGVNSQTIVLASYSRQNNPNKKMQYCSNIALKTNTKLATSNDKACAWSWGDKFGDGSEDRERMWLKEVPTLIASLSMASAQGQESKMVVVGTGYLDVEGQTCCYEARAQPKSSLIDRDVIKSVFKNLIWSFVRYTDSPPDRILIIRSSAHDGLFRDVLDKEVSAVREAFLEADLARGGEVQDCFSCGNKGCHHCCPLITCLVAQSAHHNIRLVPGDNSVQVIRNNQNVPSGTCVDSDELLLPKNAEALEDENKLRQQGEKDSGKLMLFEGTSSGRSDFLLVPHGGLKGTSNGVLYQVILNENGIFGKSGTTRLTGEMLQRVIYVLSFVYGKATKAPRDTALVRTGALLAQNLLGIISSMNREEQHDFLVEFHTSSSSTIFKTKSGDDSLMPSFGPYRGGRLCDPFRPHVLS